MVNVLNKSIKPFLRFSKKRLKSKIVLNQEPMTMSELII